ncbi:MAG: PDZ domain-containing protein [Rubritalea sp.]|uniref:PDZ domain-containing protein n=1 Tax=Rubritalea sp. TaxID=2109375 RepID=UPI003241EDFF
MITTLAAEPAAEQFKQLDADAYSDRHAAQLELTQWAADNSNEAVDLFFDKYKAAKKPELKMRMRQLLRERVVFEKYGSPKGFVGIRMDNGSEKVGDELHAVVLVTNVVKDSPADVFGLQQGDALWRIDGRTFNRKTFASIQFIQIVTSKREGDTVVLELFRNGKPLEVKLVLGAMPAKLERQNNRHLKKDPEIDKENYFNNWLRKRLGVEG